MRPRTKTSESKFLYAICILLLITNVAFGQKHFDIPKSVTNNPKLGQWKPVNGASTTGPLTTIVKKPGWTYGNWRTEVGNKLTANGANNVFFTQFTVMNSTVAGLSTTPSEFPSGDKDNDWAKDNMAAARNAKLAAFLCFLDIEVTVSGSSASFSNLSSPTKENFRQVAMAQLNIMDYAMPTNKDLGSDQLQYESKALIMALEAWDLLTSAGGTDATWAHATKLNLQFLARNIDYMANSLFTVTKHDGLDGGVLLKDNNHTLMTASALALAAIVLHDCGGGLFDTEYMPERWANRANYDIDRVMFDVQANKDGSSGYSRSMFCGTQTTD